MTETAFGAGSSPLLASDPPRLGGVTLTGRLTSADAGVVYCGTLGQVPVAVVVLNKGAETDSFARARFEDAMRTHSLARVGITPVAVDLDPEIAPWVAVRATDAGIGPRLAELLLAPTSLAGRPHGEAGGRGPDFRPAWSSTEPGRWRAWPLPWPTTSSAAGRWTYAASLGLVVAVASVALFISVRVFHDAPDSPLGPGNVPDPGLSTPSAPHQRPTPTSPGQPPTAPSGPTQTVPPIV